MSNNIETIDSYDYVIVGAGTAGCVLANRLSANPKNKILLLEAGQKDNYHWIHIPVGYLYCMGNPRTDWMMKTASEPGLNGRSLAYPRGKVLGGCTSINGMIYMRGQAADYDIWRQLGNVGWGWDDVLPFFKRSEGNYRGDTEMHGGGGEWKVAKQRLSWGILESFRDAAVEFGIPKTDDFNDGNNEGSGFFEVNQKNGIRWNTSKAFLRPIKHRKNLNVITGAEIQNIVLDGKQATGVEYIRKGKRITVKVNREVLLAAGAINSPKILELSGIGRADILSDLGIELQHESNGVGENLQDHLQIRTVYKVENANTLNQEMNSIVGKMKMGLEYLFKQSGPLSMAPSQLGIFTKSAEHLATPDLEYHVQPLSLDKLGDPLHKFPGITVSVCNLRPESVGSCHITTTDRQIQPEIKLNYLSAEKDKQIAINSVKQARQIVKAKALKKYNPQEILPGPTVQTDDDILKAAGNIGTTIFHPVGTCKMGNDIMAVVDDKLRVHGIQNLRIIDASIMPKIVSGNTASPVVMIAEKAASYILADTK